MPLLAQMMAEKGRKRHFSALFCHFRVIPPLLTTSVSLAVFSPNLETSRGRNVVEKWSILVNFDHKMGGFCPILRSILVILTLILRGFDERRICLNIQEGRNNKIQMVFIFIPYPSLGKTCIEMSFSTILDTFPGFCQKGPFFSRFPLFSDKSALFCQKEMTKMTENDPNLTLGKANKNSLDRKVVRFSTTF